MSSTGLTLVYDGHCPVCSSYVRYAKLKESVGEVRLVNAREGGDAVEEVRRAGLDLNEGMVLLYGGQLYHGADCVHMMALLSSESGLFNRVNAFIFRRHSLARSLYPALRAGRSLLLRLLNRRPIGDA